MELTLLNLNKKVSYVLICAGAVLFLTAAFGWTAAATKDDCLSFCVSNKNPHTLQIDINFMSGLVWIPCNVYNVGLHFNGRIYTDCEVLLGAINE